MFKKILSVLLALCLVGCSQPKVEDLEVFQEFGNNLLIEENRGKIIDIILNDYIEPQETEKDILEFKGLSYLFVHFTMDGYQYKITLYENEYGYITSYKIGDESEKKVIYVKYNEDSYDKIISYINH